MGKTDKKWTKFMPSWLVWTGQKMLSGSLGAIGAIIVYALVIWLVLKSTLASSALKNALQVRLSGASTAASTVN